MRSEARAVRTLKQSEKDNMGSERDIEGQKESKIGTEQGGKCAGTVRAEKNW